MILFFEKVFVTIVKVNEQAGVVIFKMICGITKYVNFVLERFRT